MVMRPLDRNSTAAGRRRQAAPGEALAAVLVERGDGPRGVGQREADRERGERAPRQHAPGGRAPGPPARRRRPGGPPARPGSRVAMAWADGVLSSAPRRHRSSKPRSASVAECELLAQARPEVLLVHHAQRDLPAVGRGEEAVARHGLRRPDVVRPPGRLRRARSRWRAHRSWRCRGRSPRRWSAAQDGGADPEGGGQPGRQVGRRQGRDAGGRAALGCQRPRPGLVVHVMAGEGARGSCCP